MESIVFVVNSLSGGGLEQVLVDVVKALHSNYHIYVITLFTTQSKYVDEIKKCSDVICLDAWRNQVQRIPLVKSIYSRTYEMTWCQRFLLDHKLRTIAPICVIAFAEGWTLKAVSSLHDKSKKIAWIHTDFTADTRIADNHETGEYRRIFSNFEDVIFVTNELSNNFQRTFHSSHGTIISNGIDISRITHLANSSVYKHDDNKCEIVCVGRLSHEKGFDRVINSFSLLNQLQREKLHLTIVGDGPQRNVLRQHVETSQLQSQVTFTGRLDNPYPVIKAAHVVIAPSRYEGFGLVVLESMALGKPIIATDTAGFREILEGGRYGTIVENNDRTFDKVLLALSEGKSNGLLLPTKDAFEYVQKYDISHFNENVLNYFKKL